MPAVKNDAGLFEVEIDGEKYEFEKWGAEDSLTNLIKLSKIVGKPLGMAAGAFKKSPGGEGLFDKAESMLDREIDFDVIGTAVDALTSAMDEGVVISLIKKMASAGVFCNGAKILFNSHYQDRLDHLFKVVYAALEVQYGNFLNAVLASAGTKKKADILRALRT